MYLELPHNAAMIRRTHIYMNHGFSKLQAHVKILKYSAFFFLQNDVCYQVVT